MTTGILRPLQIDRVKGSGKYQMLHDGEGLYLRVSPKGSKSWLFVYVFEKKQKWMSLGPCPAVSVVDARQKAVDARKLLGANVSPLDKRKKDEIEARAERQRGIIPATIASLYDSWERIDLSRLRKDQGASIRKLFEKHVFPQIGDIPLAEIRRSHVVAVLDSMMGLGISRQVNVCLSSIRQMFGFAILREWTEIDPTARIPKLQDRERERVLSESEISELFEKLPDCGLRETSSLAIWLQLSTVCRIGELMKSRWEHVDFERRIFFIPSAIRKGSIKKPASDHYIYMSDFVLAKLERLKSLTGETGWLFPSIDKKNHIDEKSVSKQVSDRQRGVSLMSKRRCDMTLVLSGGDWRMHDLRRTGATMMAGLGIRREVIEKCLSHSDQNRMSRIYQRHGFSEEMKLAWESLGNRILELSSVIHMKK